MRRALWTMGCLLLVAGALAPAVRGEDEGEGGVWTYDVRVVRVDAPSPEAVEAPTPWEAAGATTVTTPWPELLKQLKARGTTTILLDQRVTALPDMEAMLSQVRDRQIEQLQNRDLTNERWGTAPVVTGCTAKLQTDPKDLLEYHLDVKWVIRSDKPMVRPLLCDTQWNGTHPPLGGGTLVLSYREQAETWGDARIGVEVHAFVTARHQP